MSVVAGVLRIQKGRDASLGWSRALRSSPWPHSRSVSGIDALFFGVSAPGASPHVHAAGPRPSRPCLRLQASWEDLVTVGRICSHPLPWGR
jgi:hypothetical protein